MWRDEHSYITAMGVEKHVLILTWALLVLALSCLSSFVRDSEYCCRICESLCIEMYLLSWPAALGLAIESKNSPELIDIDVQIGVSYSWAVN